jgi:YVTN family beta-propeller protein
VRFGVLGAVETGDDGRDIRVGGPKQRALLAMLLLKANEVVSRDRLIEGLWGERPPPSADHTLDDYVSRLRKALGDGRLSRQPPGYVLRTELGELDLERFELLLQQGREELARADAARAAETLSAALGLWRGPALADVANEPFAAAEIARLDERRLTALENRVEADLALGVSSELVPELEALVREHPLEERLVGQLMLALYRSGRRAEALAAFQTARQFLAEELGLEPSPALRRLERAILDQDAALDPPTEHGRPSTLVAPPAAGSRRFRFGGVGDRVPLLLAAAGVLIAVVVPLAVVLSAGRSRLMAPANSVGVIDADRNALSAVVRGVLRPNGIAYGEGAAWVTDNVNDVVLRIDPGRRVVDRIPVGAGPTGVTVGGGKVWVVDQLDRTVSEVDPRARKQVATIQVGNGASAIGFGHGSVWVANTIDNTLSRIDPFQAKVVATIPLGGVPDTIAVAPRGVWVTTESNGRLLLVDPRSDRVTQAIFIGSGPRGVAVGGGSVWVANTPEDTVSRLDPGSGRVRKINVGAAPVGVAYGHGAVWVANSLGGTVSRIDPRTNSARVVRVGNDPTSVAVVGNGLWVTVLPSLESHRGGTVRVIAERQPPHTWSIDPAVTYAISTWQLLSVTNDGLVGYRRVGGLAGNTLVPDLATAVPAPTDGGKTYTFQLREGIHYSNGDLVEPQDIRRAIERVFRIRDPNPAVENWYTGIVGASQCKQRPSGCDLTRGIVTDGAAKTVTFHLTAPDPEFLYKLAFPFAYAVPAGTPNHDVGSSPLPATGPYMTASFSPGHAWLLVRNPGFREWSHDAQPDGYPDRIAAKLDATPQGEVDALKRGAADVSLFPPPNGVHELATRYRSQLHSGPLAATITLALNTRVPPFDHLLARRALNYAIDRRELVSARGGPLAAQATCQILPPTLTGYKPYCPYTLYPGPSGAWSAPNLARALQLVRASGTRGMKVTVPTAGGRDPSAAIARYVVTLLDRLGYRASLATFADPIARLDDSRYRTQIGWFPWYQDYPAPSNFIGSLLTCRSFRPNDQRNLNAAEFCSHAIDAQIKRALGLQARNASAAGELWARIDHELVDQAPWVPLYNERALTAVSARAGNYQFHPYWVVLIDQLWVR